MAKETKVKVTFTIAHDDEFQYASQVAEIGEALMGMAHVDEVVRDPSELVPTVEYIKPLIITGMPGAFDGNHPERLTRLVASARVVFGVSTNGTVTVLKNNVGPRAEACEVVAWGEPS